MGDEMNKSSYEKNIYSNIFFQIINIMLSFISSIIIARKLGPVGQGTVSYFLLIINLLSEYGSLGITNGIPYFLKKSKYENNIIFSNTILFLFINASAITLGIFILKGNNIIFSEYTNLLVGVSCINILFAYLNTFAILNNIAEEKIYNTNKILIKYKIIKIILLFLVLILGIFSISSVLYITFISNILQSIELIKSLKLKFKLNFNFKVLLDQFRYGFVIVSASLFVYLNYRIDQIFIKNYLGNDRLGLYSVAVYLAELLLIIPNSISGALLGNLANKNKNHEIIVSRTIKFSLYVSIILSLIGVLCTNLVPYVYGNDYKEINITIVILFIGIIFCGIGKVCSSYFIINNKVMSQLIISATAFIINFVLNIFFIPRLDINGAALASAISYVFYGVIYLFFLSYISKINLLDIILINKKDMDFIKNKINKFFYEVTKIGNNNKK